MLLRWFFGSNFRHLCICGMDACRRASLAPACMLAGVTGIDKSMSAVLFLWHQTIAANSERRIQYILRGFCRTFLGNHSGLDHFMENHSSPSFAETNSQSGLFCLGGGMLCHVYSSISLPFRKMYSNALEALEDIGRRCLQFGRIGGYIGRLSVFAGCIVECVILHRGQHLKVPAITGWNVISQNRFKLFHSRMGKIHADSSTHVNELWWLQSKSDRFAYGTGNAAAPAFNKLHIMKSLCKPFVPEFWSAIKRLPHRETTRYSTRRGDFQPIIAKGDLNVARAEICPMQDRIRNDLPHRPERQFIDVSPHSSIQACSDIDLLLDPCIGPSICSARLPSNSCRSRKTALLVPRKIAHCTKGISKAVPASRKNALAGRMSPSLSTRIPHEQS